MRTKMVAIAAALLFVLSVAPAHAAYGTKTDYCKTHFKQARAVVRGTVLGVDANALQMTCGQKSVYGSSYIRWTSTPHPSFTAHNMLGNIQFVDVTWGPKVTRVVWQRMSPWQDLSGFNLAYMQWVVEQKILGNKPLYRPVMVVHSYTVRICTMSIAGVHHCADSDYKTQNKYGYGLRVCVIAPAPSKCGDWKRFS